MKSVLIISDDQDLATGLKTALWSNEFNFNILPSHDHVVEELIRIKPDLILIDFLLNNANGGSLCHEIRGHRDLHQLPLILLTNYPIERFTAKFGCNAIVRKPVMMNDLIDTLSMMLEDTAVVPHVLERAS
ncbi:response regulator [Mucilaginibacter panaciglaebae]|uniref:Response regulatory domain-containing protein n=1 Tax=Mucilaginibacter panaciglaebae TaxID=502331 RepID=A0ABP7WED8_9SPHI